MLLEGIISDVGVRAGQINLGYFLISHRLQTKNEKKTEIDKTKLDNMIVRIGTSVC